MPASSLHLPLEPLLTKTQYVLTSVAPDLIPCLRAIRSQAEDARRNTAGDGTVELTQDVVERILSALRVAGSVKRAHAAPVVLLEAAWNRVCEALGADDGSEEQESQGSDHQRHFAGF